MTKQGNYDFETSWQNKFSREIENKLGEGASEGILEGGKALHDDSPTAEKITWTCRALDRLAGITDEKTRQDILIECACQYPIEELQDVKAAYQESRDVDLAISLLQAKFEFFLRETMELEEELVHVILAKGWGVAGVRQGNTIISTKIPKSGYLRQYFNEDDPLEMRRYYCHCPRVRDGINNQPILPLTYCFCGAGFYKGIWEEILGEPVEVEMLESVIQGDEACKIAIHLPNQVLSGK